AAAGGSVTLRQRASSPRAGACPRAARPCAAPAGARRTGAAPSRRRRRPRARRAGGRPGRPAPPRAAPPRRRRGGGGRGAARPPPAQQPPLAGQVAADAGTPTRPRVLLLIGGAGLGTLGVQRPVVQALVDTSGQCTEIAAQQVDDLVCQDLVAPAGNDVQRRL